VAALKAEHASVAAKGKQIETEAAPTREQGLVMLALSSGQGRLPLDHV